MSAKKYRKKPVVIEAMQFDGTNQDDFVAWFDSSDVIYWIGKFFITIATLEGDMRAAAGDYIIKGVYGEFYPCKPDTFAATYEEVGSDE